MEPLTDTLKKLAVSLKVNYEDLLRKAGILSE
jgi:hypothetical protein